MYTPFLFLELKLERNHYHVVQLDMYKLKSISHDCTTIMNVILIIIFVTFRLGINSVTSLKTYHTFFSLGSLPSKLSKGNSALGLLHTSFSCGGFYTLTYGTFSQHYVL